MRWVSSSPFCYWNPRVHDCDAGPIAFTDFVHNTVSSKFRDAIFEKEKSSPVVPHPYKELLDLLKVSDETTQLLASRTLGVILSYAYNPASKHKQSETQAKEGGVGR